MKIELKIKRWNQKWLALCLGSFLLGGSVSGGSNKPRIDIKFPLLTTFPSNRAYKFNFVKESEQGIVSVQEEEDRKKIKIQYYRHKPLPLFMEDSDIWKNFKKNIIVPAREQTKTALIEMFQKPGAVDFTLWKKLAKQQAISRWNTLGRLIVRSRIPLSIKSNSPFDIQVIYDRNYERARNLCSSYKNLASKGEKTKFLKKLEIQTILVFLQCVSDEDRLAIFACLPPLLQSILSGIIIRMCPSIGNQIWEYLPVDERILYFILLSSDAQQKYFASLPLFLQEKLRAERAQMDDTPQVADAN